MTNEEMLASIKEMFAEERKATDAKTESSQKETIDMLHEEMQSIAQVAADRAVRQVQALLENREDKQIQLITEGYREILRRLPDPQEQEDLKSRVVTLEHVAADHTKRLENLEQA